MKNRIAKIGIATTITAVLSGAVVQLHKQVGQPRKPFTRVEANQAVYVVAGLTAAVWTLTVL